jgi:multidrug efflux pump subunit AcrA (membrane-fusion protein)
MVSLGFYSLIASASDPANPEKKIVENKSVIFEVSEKNMTSVLRLGGSVVPKKTVNLIAQVPGDVEYVAGSEGDAFNKDDVLVTLDRKSLLAKRQQAEAQLGSAHAAYRNAVVQYNQERVNPHSQANSMMGGAPDLFSIFSDPTRSMMGKGDPGFERHSNLVARSVGIETAQNSIKQATASIRELDEALKNTVSRAPFDGVILKKMVEKGDIVQPGMPLVTFGDINRLQIRVDVPTRLLKVIKSGIQVEALLDGETEPVTVVVARIFPMADTGGHTTTVKFDLPISFEAHSGMYAEIMLPDPESQHTALPMIPKSAIVWRGSLPAVYEVYDNGDIKIRLIRIDEMGEGDMVSVISGISAGDRILTNPGPNPRNLR